MPGDAHAVVRPAAGATSPVPDHDGRTGRPGRLVGPPAGRGPRRRPATPAHPVRARDLRPARGVRRGVLRCARRPGPRLVPAPARFWREAGAGSGEVHWLRRRPRGAHRAHHAAVGRICGPGHGQPWPGGQVEHRRDRRPGGRRAWPGELSRADPGHHLRRGLLLHPAVRRRGARRRDGRRAGRRRPGPDRGERRQPGRRAGPGCRGADDPGTGSGTGPGLPRGRPIPVRHPAGDHPGAGTALHRGTGVPRPERRPDPGRAGHPAAHRLRAPGPADQRRMPAQHWPDGWHLPTVDGVRRVQRDQCGQGHRRAPLQRARGPPDAHREPAQGPAPGLRAGPAAQPG